MAARRFSIEDGNLSSASIVTAIQRINKDIDLSFESNSIGDVYKKNDLAAVRQAIKNILLTNQYEKPFQPLFGADLRSLLFELNDPDLPETINDRVRQAIANFEPRARVKTVTVSTAADYNSVNVSVEFQIVSTSEVTSVNVDLARLR